MWIINCTVACILMKYMFWQIGDTPLHRASYNGEVEAMTLLLQKGANIDKVNNVSKSKLYEG